MRADAQGILYGDVLLIGGYSIFACSAVPQTSCDALCVGQLWASHGLASGASVWSIGVDGVLPELGDFYGVWGCGDDGTLLVGSQYHDLTKSVAAVHSGGKWVESIASAKSYSGLGSLSGAAADDLYTFDHSGKIVHWDGAAFSTVPGPSGVTSIGALAAAKNGADSVIALASGPTIYQRSGGTWAAFGPKIVTHFDGKPWGSPDGSILIAPAPGGSVWATSDGGTSWAQVPITASSKPTRIYQIAALPASGGYTYYAAGDQGLVLRAADLASGFTTVDLDAHDASIVFQSVVATGGALYATATSTDSSSAHHGFVYTGAGGTWSKILDANTDIALQFGNPYESSIVSVTVASSVFVGGELNYKGFIAERAMGAWKVVYSGDQYEIVNAISVAKSSDVWAVSGPMPDTGVTSFDGHLLHRVNGQFVDFPTPPGLGLNDLHGSGGGDLFAVGDTGLVMSYFDGNWFRVPIGTAVNLDGVWVDSKSVWVGGADRLLRASR